MLDKITYLKSKLSKIEVINEERQNRVNELNSLLDSYFAELEKIKEEYKIVKFTLKELGNYYKKARDSNLISLGTNQGEFMTELLNRPFEVSMEVRNNGKYDYLDIFVNGTTPKRLSGGEKQVLSVSLTLECVGNNVVILDETLNSLDPVTLQGMIDYLKQESKDKQIIVIELDKDLFINDTDTDIHYIRIGGDANEEAWE